MKTARKILLTALPYPQRVPSATAAPWHPQEYWPAKWLRLPHEPAEPFVAAFRLDCVLDTARTIRVHVSADERYALYLNAAQIGRGPEYGDKHNWFFESYDLALEAGTHTLLAIIWAMKRLAPWAQASVYPGFILAPDDEALVGQLATGVAPWRCTLLPGYRFIDASGQTRTAMGVGPAVDLDGAAMYHEIHNGVAPVWELPRVADGGNNGFALQSLSHVHFMRPALLPEPLTQPRQPGKARHVSIVPATQAQPDFSDTTDAALLTPVRDFLEQGSPLTVPAYTSHRVLLDLEDYACCYPSLTVSGGKGAEVQLGWAESLLVPNSDFWDKGQRDEIGGKFFRGLTDIFRPSGRGRERFETLWWRCGRYILLTIATGADALTLDDISLEETRFPLESLDKFDTTDVTLDHILRTSLRTLQMCAHETYLDCPYYEQLQYAGDTRLQMLCGYVLGTEGNLPRKAMELFDSSRANPTRLSVSSHPSGGGQIIPPFALWHVAMLHDHALWRGNHELIANLIPGARDIVERFLLHRTADGLIKSPQGWNFVDGVFPNCIPPGGVAGGCSALVNLQLAMALRHLAVLEHYLDEPELAARAKRLHRDLAAAIQSAFWNAQRECYADDASHTQFSQHAQCLAILSGTATSEQRPALQQALLQDAGLLQASLYFSHYLFETFFELGCAHHILPRLASWKKALELGFRTFPEYLPPGNRSDCHAWAAHPLYHLPASVLGIRPGAMGFKSVSITPAKQLPPTLRGMLHHPNGRIVVYVDADMLHVTLPKDLAGTFILKDKTIALRSGMNVIPYA